jgi:phosphoribosylamine--glycine ligase
MRAAGTPFRGFLYPGLVLTRDGPKVLEFNVRLGDPEAEAVLPLLETDLLDLLEAALEGRLEGAKPAWREGGSACVVMAAPGYPEAPVKGVPVELPPALPEGAAVLHAGTARDDRGRLVSSGGRVLAVTALGGSLDEALVRAYRAVEGINFPGALYRRDIGGRPSR